jgi:CRISPR-associated protein Cst1
LSEIVLYPSNWLYNAGVVGFLHSLQEVEKIQVEGFLKEDGTVVLPANLFAQLNWDLRYFSETRLAAITGQAKIYRNYWQPSWDKSAFGAYVAALENLRESSLHSCSVCGRNFEIPEPHLQALVQRFSFLKTFLSGVSTFDVRLNMMLAPSIGEFPNSLWNLRSGSCVCPLCSFLLVHQHLSFLELIDSDGKASTSVFVNAPSFKVMWYLNRLVKEVYSREKISFVRELLGVSLIEFAMRVNAQLGMWTKMNIEVVSWKRDGTIDFYVLPYQVADLLLDWRVASLLSDIGEFSVLKMVLEERFYEIVELGEKIMAIGIKRKNEWGKQEKAYINQHLRLSRNKDRPDNLVNFASRLFSLYALIQEKQGVKGNER